MLSEMASLMTAIDTAVLRNLFTVSLTAGTTVAIVILMWMPDSPTNTLEGLNVLREESAPHCIFELPASCSP